MTQLLKPPNYTCYDDVLEALRDGPLTAKEVALRLGVVYETALLKLHAAWRDNAVERTEPMPYRWRL